MELFAIMVAIFLWGLFATRAVVENSAPVPNIQEEMDEAHEAMMKQLHKDDMALGEPAIEKEGYR